MLNNKREIARFCGQLKMLLSSGVPLLESLKIIKNMLHYGKLEEVTGRIAEGESMAEALRKSARRAAEVCPTGAIMLKGTGCAGCRLA